jgi:hypothetical protein
MDTRALVSSAGLLISASCFVCNAGVAQWSVGAEVGADRFWGGAVERAGLHRSLLPYRPTTFVLSVQRQSGKATIGMRIGYFSAALALEGAEGLSAVKGVFQVYSASPELTYQLAAPGLTNQLLVHGGPIVEVWSIGDDGSETRVGGQVALSLSIPLGGRFAGSARGGVAIIPSPLANRQLDGSFEPRPLWRRQVAAGLSYRL